MVRGALLCKILWVPPGLFVDPSGLYVGYLIIRGSNSVRQNKDVAETSDLAYTGRILCPADSKWGE